jgi:hypothetical protein
MHQVHTSPVDIGHMQPRRFDDFVLVPRNLFSFDFLFFSPFLFPRAHDPRLVTLVNCLSRVRTYYPH